MEEMSSWIVDLGFKIQILAFTEFTDEAGAKRRMAHEPLCRLRCAGIESHKGDDGRPKAAVQRMCYKLLGALC